MASGRGATENTGRKQRAADIGGAQAMRQAQGPTTTGAQKIPGAVSRPGTNHQFQFREYPGRRRNVKRIDRVGAKPSAIA
jgi:hypothetical protein